MSATQIIVLYHCIVVDASKITFWLGRLADVSWQSVKKAPSKCTLHKYMFAFSCACFSALHFCVLNGGLAIPPYNTHISIFSSQQHPRLISQFYVDAHTGILMCAEAMF